MHAADLVALRHLLVDDAASGCHPLDVAGGDGAAVAHAVPVLHGPGEDVGDRLDAAVRVPGETGQVILRDVIAEVIEEEERVEVGRVAEAERAAQVHACAFERRLGPDQPLDGSNGHVGLRQRWLCRANIAYPSAAPGCVALASLRSRIRASSAGSTG